MSPERKRVLAYFHDYVVERSGKELTDLTGLGSGVVYAVLYALEENGTLTSRWEEGPYPRRRLYSRLKP